MEMFKALIDKHFEITDRSKPFEVIPGYHPKPIDKDLISRVVKPMQETQSANGKLLQERMDISMLASLLVEYRRQYSLAQLSILMAFSRN